MHERAKDSEKPLGSLEAIGKATDKIITDLENQGYCYGQIVDICDLVKTDLDARIVEATWEAVNKK